MRVAPPFIVFLHATRKDWACIRSENSFYASCKENECIRYIDFCRSVRENHQVIHLYCISLNAVNETVTCAEESPTHCVNLSRDAKFSRKTTTCTSISMPSLSLLDDRINFGHHLPQITTTEASSIVGWISIWVWVCVYSPCVLCEQFAQ